MAKKSIRLANMTSTEIFKMQIQSIYGKMRHENDPEDPNVQFIPTHMGGVPGQRDILTGQNIMRQTRITP